MVRSDARLVQRYPNLPPSPLRSGTDVTDGQQHKAAAHENALGTPRGSPEALAARKKTFRGRGRVQALLEQYPLVDDALMGPAEPINVYASKASVCAYV